MSIKSCADDLAIAVAKFMRPDGHNGDWEGMQEALKAYLSEIKDTFCPDCHQGNVDTFDAAGNCLGQSTCDTCGGSGSGDITGNDELFKLALLPDKVDTHERATNVVI